MMFGMMVVGIVMVAVVRVVDTERFSFKFAISISHFSKFRFTAIPVLIQQFFFALLL